MAYLLLHRHQAVPREQAAYLLWPDDAEDEARANLRRHLNELQKHLPQSPSGPWVLAEGATIRFNPDAPYWLDVAEFERCIVARETLAEAAELYRGDLLENVSDDWVFHERERFRSAYLTVLDQLIHAKRSVRDYQAATAYAERLLTYDALREDAARQLMALRYEAGDRAGALRVFEQFSARLRQELDVEPMPETIALHEAIVRNAAIPGVADAQAAIADGPAKIMLPFVGRATELEQLRSWWSRAARGRGQGILIGGEAGIGKTRLATELTFLAQAQGARVLTGSTAFAEASPYQAIAEAVRSALPLMTTLDVEPLHLAALSRLVPELRARRPGLPEPAPIEIDREQVRLFDALARCLEALAVPRPVLLILEDLHWAGAATVAAFEFLARRSTQHPVLVVATYREEETPRAHPLRDVRRRLQQEKALVHMSLGRLPLEAVETLAAQMPAFSAVRHNVAKHLYDESEGNPFFLSEVIRDLTESPTTQEPATAAQGTKNHLATGVGAIISARVARLSTEARALAEVGAVIGRAFDVELLREVSRWEEGEVLDTLSELLDRHLVREIGGRTHVDYAFSHHLIQAAIYDAIPDDNRKHRHRRIAGVMEELYATKSDELAAELALHWDRGAQAQRAAAYFLRAAQRALAVFAVDEALGYLNRGVELANDEDLLAHLHMLRAEVRWRRGDAAGQREDLDAIDRLAELRSDEDLLCEVLHRRILLARSLGDRDVEAQLIVALKAKSISVGGLRWQAKAVQDEAAHFVLVGRFDDAVEAATKAAAMHQQLDDKTGQLECICLLAEMAARRGNVAETHALLQEARSCAGSPPNPSLIARATIAAARAANIRQDFSEASKLGREALELYRTAGDRGGEADALYCIGAASIGQRKFEDARLYDAQAAEIYGAIGNRRGVANVLMDSAIVASALGLFVEAENFIAKATSQFEALKDVRGLTLCALYLSDFRRHTGDALGAKESAVRALEFARTLKMPWMEATALANLGDAERDAGDFASALQHLETAVGMIRELHRPVDIVEMLAGLALAHLRAGDLESARRAADELLADTDSIASAHRPQYCYWAAAQSYRACAEEKRCREALQYAHDFMEKSAADIPEADTRAAYLNQSFNQEIAAAYSRDIWPANPQNL